MHAMSCVKGPHVAESAIFEGKKSPKAALKAVQDLLASSGYLTSQLAKLVKQLNSSSFSWWV